MNQASSEAVLEVRPLVVWWWLMGCLLLGADVDGVAAYLSIAALLFAGARWSQTVRRESAVALVVFDAPAIFTILSRQSPSGLALAGLGALLFAGVLLAGVLTLRRALALCLVLEVVLLQGVLLSRPAAPSEDPRARAATRSRQDAPGSQPRRDVAW